MPTPNVGGASDDATLTIPSLAAGSFRAEVRLEVDELESDDQRLVAAHQRIAAAIGDRGDVMVTDHADVLATLVAMATKAVALRLADGFEHRLATTHIRHDLLVLSIWVDVIDGHDWLAARHEGTDGGSR